MAITIIIMVMFNIQDQLYMKNDLDKTFLNEGLL